MVRALGRYLRQIQRAPTRRITSPKRWPAIPAASPPSWSSYSTPVRPAQGGRSAPPPRRQIRERDRRTAQECHEPRRRPDPAPLHQPDRSRRSAPTSSSSRTTGARARPSRSSSNALKVEGLALPRPLYEIFVYSPRVEGVHLRFGKVSARRPALVRPSAGFPHRGARPRQGAAGQERGHRAGGRQGRLRPQAPAGAYRPRRPG